MSTGPMQEHADVQTGLLVTIGERLEAIENQLKRADEWGAIDAITRLSWQAGASADFNERGNFRSVVVVNENDFAVTVGLAPGAGARAGQPETLTLPARGYVVIPARGVTVSVGAAAAGSATVIPLAVTMPFVAGSLGAPGTGAGNPTDVGGVVSTAAPGAAATGALRDLWLGANGQVTIGLAPGGIADGQNAGQLLDAAGVIRLLSAAPWLYNGATWDRQRGPAVFKPINAVALALNTDAAVWTPAAGKKFRLMGYVLSLSVAARVLIKDGAATTILVENLAANGRVTSPPMGNGILSATANNALIVNAGAAGTLDGYVFGTEE